MFDEIMQTMSKGAERILPYIYSEIGLIVIAVILICLLLGILIYWVSKRRQRLYKEMKEQIQVGQRYKDLKGKHICTVVAAGWSQDTRSIPIVCFADENDVIWVYPYKTFVKKIKYKGEKTLRFQIETP